MAARKGKTPKQEAEILEKRRAGLRKAHAARRVLLEKRRLVQEKIENDLPITEQERQDLNWNGGNLRGKTKEKLVMAAAAKLMIKPQSVSELRLLVETTAAKNHYNPIEKLIHLSSDPNVKESEKIAIHKALLPFLVPQLAAPKAGTGEHTDSGVKVTVTQFVFPDKKSSGPLHQEKPATVETTKT